jgi:deoxyribose-phosphate aldolase
MKDFSKYIDHTLLSPKATEADIVKLCNDAKTFNFCSVCVHPAYVKLCKKLLKNSSVKVCTVIGFPFGQNTTQVKVFEAKQAIKDGAEEIDMVINVAKLLENDLKYVENEIAEIRKVCESKILKVIIETCYLNDEQLKNACIVCINAKADFVKTSTGYGTGGASIEVVKKMKKIIKNKALIKASGGIRDKEFALNLIKAGASRLGTSSAIAFMQADNKTNNNDNKDY